MRREALPRPSQVLVCCKHNPENTVWAISSQAFAFLAYLVGQDRGAQHPGGLISGNTLPIKIWGWDVWMGMGRMRLAFPSRPVSSGCDQDCRAFLGSRSVTSTPLSPLPGSSSLTADLTSNGNDAGGNLWKPDCAWHPAKPSLHALFHFILTIIFEKEQPLLTHHLQRRKLRRRDVKHLTACQTASKWWSPDLGHSLVPGLMFFITLLVLLFLSWSIENELFSIIIIIFINKFFLHQRASSSDVQSLCLPKVLTGIKKVLSRLWN